MTPSGGGSDEEQEDHERVKWSKVRAYSQGRIACQQSTAGRKLVVNHGNATLLILDSVTQVGHPPSKTVVFVSLGFFLKARAETSFCLKEERSATAAPSPPPPCSKRTPTRFHRRLVGTLSRALLGTPPSLAKQVAKIATRGRSPPRCFCCCLVWEKVWRYLGMGNGYTSFPALLGRRHTTLSRAYFPCCPRLPATEQHHLVSSTRRLSVKHKHPVCM